MDEMERVGIDGDKNVAGPQEYRYFEKHVGNPEGAPERVYKRIPGLPGDEMGWDGVQEAPEEIEMLPDFGAGRPAADQRLNVRFTPEAYTQLQEMARRRGKSVSETVRDALGLDQWIEDQLASGYSLQLKRGDGAVKTVARPGR